MKESPDTEQAVDEPIHWQAICEMHCEMFRHYSLMLFRARILIISVILLVFAFLLGLKKVEPGIAEFTFAVEPTAMISFVASVAIALLYSMETAYIRRLAEVAASARQSMKEASGAFAFFACYKPLWHWPLLALYFSAVFFLLVIYWSSTSSLAYLLTIVPPGLLIYTTARHRSELEKLRD